MHLIKINNIVDVYYIVELYLSRSQQVKINLFETGQVFNILGNVMGSNTWK